MTNTTRSSASSLMASLDLVEVKPGKKFSKAVLKDLLPTVADILFFGKMYQLDVHQLSNLLYMLVRSPLADALSAGDHSVDLQDYLVDDIMPYASEVEDGDVTFSPSVPHGEILPEVWAGLEVEIANSIKAVAMKLESVIDKLPGKQGQMMFRSLQVMNAKRPTLGDYKAGVHHAPQAQNLVILDVSGSMNEPTIKAIVNDVVALSYKANAHMAVVSNTCTYWVPGSYDVDDVLRAAEYGGTQYEQLAPLFNEHDWGTVITVADYDSSRDAKRVLAGCTSHIDQVLDISLVNRPTFLAECVGQLADETRPLLVGSSQYVLS